TESLDALAAQARIAAQHVAERIAERAADEARRHQPTYVHVAAGKTAAQFHAPLTALEDLGQAPHVRASGGMYRLYVGPIPAHQADELRQALRQHGIATFTTQRPSGDTATLPDTETETAALTEAPVDAPIADNKDASVATTELDTEPAAHVIAEADEATSEAEETPDATAEEAT